MVLRRVWKSLFDRECEHKHTLVVSSVGVRRTVCEACGHISFKMTPNLVSAQMGTAHEDLPKVSGL